MNSTLIQTSISFAAGLIVCLLLIPVIIKMSLKYKLVDIPNERKVHTKIISRLGGVGIFASAAIASVVASSSFGAFTGWPVLFTSLLALFLVGIWDDLKNISAKLRFALQIAFSTAVAITGIRLTSLYGVFGIEELNTFWQYFLTIVIITGSTNAFNLIDGVDGLAGGMALIGLIVLSFISYSLGLYSLLVILLAFTGAVIGFLKNNFSPAKIFMGDGGSLVLGYLLSSTGILLIEKSNEMQAEINPSRVALAVFAILIIPVFDSLRVFAHRIRKGMSPLKADKTHIHHLFLVAGLNHKKTALFLYAFELVLLACAFFLHGIAGISIAILVMVLLFHFITEILRINQGVETWLAIIKKMENE